MLAASNAHEINWEKPLTPKQQIKKRTLESAHQSISQIFLGIEGEGGYEVLPRGGIPAPNQIIDIEWIGNTVLPAGNVATKSIITLHKNSEQHKDKLKGVTTARISKMDTKTGKVELDLMEAPYQNHIRPILDNPQSQYVRDPKPVTVTQLKCSPGGYIGTAHIEVTGFGTIQKNCFIPGSNVALNNVDNIRSMEGKTVKGFIQRVEKGEYGLIISPRDYLRHLGNMNMEKMFDQWVDMDTHNWKYFSDQIFEGRVTGVINTKKKKGIFVELPGNLNITVYITLNKGDEIKGMKFGKKIKVQLIGFEHKMFYNADFDQYQTVCPPFEWSKEGTLQNVNVFLKAKVVDKE